MTYTIGKPIVPLNIVIDFAIADFSTYRHLKSNLVDEHADAMGDKLDPNTNIRCSLMPLETWRAIIARENKRYSTE
jgi:hypothetical protein